MTVDDATGSEPLTLTAPSGARRLLEAWRTIKLEAEAAETADSGRESSGVKPARRSP